MGLLDALSNGLSRQNFESAAQSPLFNIGLGLLARPDQRLGQAIGGSIYDMQRAMLQQQAYKQMQQQMQQQADERERQMAARQKCSNFIQMLPDCPIIYSPRS